MPPPLPKKKKAGMATKRKQRHLRYEKERVTVLAWQKRLRQTACAGEDSDAATHFSCPVQRVGNILPPLSPPLTYEDAQLRGTTEEYVLGANTSSDSAYRDQDGGGWLAQRAHIRESSRADFSSLAADERLTLICIWMCMCKMTYGKMTGSDGSSLGDTHGNFPSLHTVRVAYSDAVRELALELAFGEGARPGVCMSEILKPLICAGWVDTEGGSIENEEIILTTGDINKGRAGSDLEEYIPLADGKHGKALARYHAAEWAQILEHY